jgi:AcrR family transcriptional regulator
MLPHARELHWIRAPRQERTHQSLERLLDVTAQLLRDKPFDELHVRELALRAETSVAAFYRRFKDKDGLLHALHERRCEEAFATADDALAPAHWEGANIQEILSTIFPFLIEIMRPNENLYRAIYQRAISDTLMHERATKLDRYVVSKIYDLLIARKDEIRHPNPKTAISFSLTQSVALLIQQYTVGIFDIGPVSINDDTISDEMTHSCLAYLGVANSALNKETPSGGDLV